MPKGLPLQEEEGPRQSKHVRRRRKKPFRGLNTLDLEVRTLTGRIQMFDWTFSVRPDLTELRVFLNNFEFEIWTDLRLKIYKYI
jgi:hypothetical protein